MVKNPFCTLDPFPQIFSPLVGPNGNILSSPSGMEKRVFSVPMISHLQTTKGISKYLDETIGEFISNQSKWTVWLSDDIREEVTDTTNHLQCIFDQYVE